MEFKIKLVTWFSSRACPRWYWIINKVGTRKRFSFPRRKLTGWTWKLHSATGQCNKQSSATFNALIWNSRSPSTLNSNQSHYFMTLHSILFICIYIPFTSRIPTIIIDVYVFLRLFSSLLYILKIIAQNETSIVNRVIFVLKVNISFDLLSEIHRFLHFLRL